MDYDIIRLRTIEGEHLSWISRICQKGDKEYKIRDGILERKNELYL